MHIAIHILGFWAVAFVTLCAVLVIVALQLDVAAQKFIFGA
jgi:hypothetical protein